MKPKDDFILSGGGRIYLLTPLTDAACHWLRTQTAEETGLEFVVERRYLRYTVDAIKRAGLTISVQPQDKAA